MFVFSHKPKRQPKVIRAKLGKENVWGSYDIHNKNGVPRIRVDERLKGKRELIIYLHEFFHHIFPEMTEDDIIVKSEETAHFLWRNDFRKVDNKE